MKTHSTADVPEYIGGRTGEGALPLCRRGIMVPCTKRPRHCTAQSYPYFQTPTRPPSIEPGEEGGVPRASDRTIFIQEKSTTKELV